ncbi:PEP-CTERM sorting domain-containing protein [Nitrosospira sp. NRS527]|uniref:PEP-CTERM sorting domain-containing protein n=1 Tax=Nitrosospira sp. NRS527 TaxID=155925 RepID=UPI001AFC1239|nr:PEP-CTERM sorting domain-containing protein [Nitrosospira sp. NRS527]BCT66631.1 hypothetical protein NNRS527_00197 [Nitrosospira sp. NRS527]
MDNEYSAASVLPTGMLMLMTFNIIHEQGLHMKKTLRYALFIAGMISLPAFAHVGYTGRNFGTFDNTYAMSSISNQAVTGNYGWIDGTDADYGDAHKTLAYRFTLLNPTDVTLSFASQVYTAAAGAAPVLDGLTPGFSLYQGLAHVAPIGADYDSSDISKANRPADTEGSFRALNDWKIGNAPDPVKDLPAALSFFKYVGHAYDGTGTIPGFDGVADGKVSHTFMNLAAGDYSVFVGGSDYLAQDIANPHLLDKYGVTGTLVAGVVPEPETYAMLLAGLGLMGTVVHRRKSRQAL